MLDVLVAPRRDTLTEPVVAWRTWILAGSRDGEDLRLLPLFGDRRPWPPREPMRASCVRRGRHPVPDLTCTCGVYATHGLAGLRRARDPAVLGTVALWGRVVEHTAGYRAEYGYPQRLRLVCFVCAFLAGPGGGERCDVVVRHRGGRLVPLCREHLELARRYGYPTPRLLDGRAVEQRLLDTYAVDPLPTA
ncbi:hypothetical protein HRbin12_00206 [bacterium HR12]|nr:hypothetical protein HRbin12_00206 [bacterium HR12]